MFKRFSIILLTLSIFTLVACTPEEEELSDIEIISNIKDTISFEDTQITEDIVIPIIDEENVTTSWASDDSQYLDIDGTVNRPDFTYGDKIVTLTLTLTLNDTTSYMNFTFTVIAEDVPDLIELNTDETDSLALDFNYEGLNFIADGVGEVNLVSCVDGDTAVFSQDGDNFTVRFLGIDTPESTAKFEPWGKAASNFTCDKLTNAETIVLRADPESGRMDSYGTRYLAWVWYDGRLLNLELVEQAYSKAKSAIDTYYGDVIFNVNRTVLYSGRRVWGEVDPDFDYSLEGVQLTIEELVTNFDEYDGKKVVITGVITSKVGAAVYIQQEDFGIFVYVRNASPHLVVGNEVLLSGLTATQYPADGTGAIQCSGYQALDEFSKVLSTGNVVEPNEITILELTDNHIGSFLEIKDLTVISVYEGEGSFTITAEDSLGNTISIRKDSDSNLDIQASMFQEGTVFSIVGPLSRYQSTYQLMLTDEDNLTIK